MDASGYFALSRPDLSRNQYGGAVGGPIVKGKIFFRQLRGLRLTQAVVFLHSGADGRGEIRETSVPS